MGGNVGIPHERKENYEKKQQQPLEAEALLDVAGDRE
jgi:hypothetical protein